MYFSFSSPPILSSSSFFSLFLFLYIFFSVSPTLRNVILYVYHLCCAHYIHFGSFVVFRSNENGCVFFWVNGCLRLGLVCTMCIPYTCNTYASSLISLMCQSMSRTAKKITYTKYSRCVDPDEMMNVYVCVCLF